MTSAPPRVVTAMWNALPASLRGRLRSRTGSRFVRFVPVAIAAFAATQITIFVLVLTGITTAGVSALIGAVVGAAVSYVLSRWAWERKGRPAVLTETIPFWLVSLGAWSVLSAAGHYGGVWANSMHATSGLKRAIIINGVTAAANCFTFVARFVIFHYVLFVDRGASRPAAGAMGVPLDDRDPSAPFALAEERAGQLSPASGAAPGEPGAHR